MSQTNGAAEPLHEYGFKQSSLPLLHRSASADASAVSAALIEKLCPAPCPHPPVDTPGDRIETTNDNWSLQVFGDGTSVRFRDLVVGKRAHSLAKTYAEKTTSTVVEQAGRKVIASKLGSLIVLSPGEELVPVRTDYRIEGGYNIKSRETVRSVVASRIVFGRVIAGVPIVGGGSTVILTFINDGSLESFQYDWPKYEQSTARAVVSRDEILRRVRRVVSMRAGNPVAGSSGRIPGEEGPAHAIELTKNTVLQGLDCGYYDPGYAARMHDAVVQSGCVYHAVSRSEDGTRSGFAGAVPGGTQIEPDAAWAEAVLLRGPAQNSEPIIPKSSRSQK